LTVFVDTSALFSLLDADDAGHAIVLPAWNNGIDDCAGFVTSDYAVVETIALAQRKLGLRAVRTLVEEMLPMLDVVWVTEADHSTALNALLAADRRSVSLVDWVSFTVMRRMGIREYLGLDPHFAERGLTPYAPAG
jgi:predicted nucleic acid-binding protein